MKIVCTMPARNEDWVLGLSARAVLKWVDELVILDHASKDDTLLIATDVAEEYPGSVHILHELSPVWEEMRHRQRMLGMARTLNATHVVMVDADEVLTGNLLPMIRKLVQETPAGTILTLPWLCLRSSIERVHDSGHWGSADITVGFWDADIWRFEQPGYDFHHRYPAGRPLVMHKPICGRVGGLMHLQFVSDRRLRAKQYLYQLTERSRWPNRMSPAALAKMYGDTVYGHLRSTAGAVVPDSWWAPYQELLRHLKPDAEPWQEAECRRLLSEDSSLAEGLDDFGLKAVLSA